MDEGHAVAVDDDSRRVELVLFYFNSYIFELFFGLILWVRVLLPLVEVEKVISFNFLCLRLFLVNLLLCLLFLFLFQHFL